jgi:hypothetical protein
MRSLLIGLLSCVALEAGVVRAEHVYLKCLGNVPGPRYLDGRTADGTVGLAPNTGFTGTKWNLQKLNDGTYIVQCLGNLPGPKFLDGRTGTGTVGLATTTAGFSGTRWQLLNLGNGEYALECLGNVEGPRFLDGRTGNGSVGLAPESGGGFTGTKWQKIPAN